MNAEVIGIGPFSQALTPHLEYEVSAYADTREGVTIAENVFCMDGGNSKSERLAEYFGIDPWDFNQHELDASKADLDGLRRLCGDFDVETFIALREAGFRFFFLPNG